MAVDADVLFEGDCLPLGGLSNEDELARLCPAEFRGENDWTDYANRLAQGETASPRSWSWKADSDSTKVAQYNSLRAIATGFIRYEDKVSVMAWMLSVMLHQVPASVSAP